MVSLWAYVKSRTAGEQGATMVEYAMILLSIAVVAVISAALIGPVVRDNFIGVEDCFDAVC